MSVVPATSADIGPMVSGADVEAAVKATVYDWLPSYLAEYERKHGLEVGSIARPRGWVVTGRLLDKMTSDQLPCVALMSTGVVSEPRPEGSPGTYTVRWGVDLGVVFNAAWGESSRRDMQAYVCALCLIMEQRPLEGLPSMVDWRGGEVYDEVDFADTRSYSAGVCRFDVEVRDARRRDGGPPPYVAPPTDPTVPFDPWVTVTQTQATVEPLP